MAKRRRSRRGVRRARARVRRRVTHRRRRRTHRVTAVALQRRGRTVYRSNPRRRHRRRYRRNPGIGGGVVAILKTGVKEGAIVLAGQIGTRKVINLVGAFNPIKGLPGTAITGLSVPVAVTLVARKVAPQYARLIAAAAFAEGLRDILMATPAAPFLGESMDARYASEELGAWPAPQVQAAMGAYPGFAGEEVEFVQ